MIAKPVCLVGCDLSPAAQDRLTSFQKAHTGKRDLSAGETPGLSQEQLEWRISGREIKHKESAGSLCIL